jgi:hypothetical protein
MAIDERPNDEALRALIQEARSSGSETIRIEVTGEAATGWARAGFSEVARILVAPVDALEQRLAGTGGRSFGAVHVQTDDVDAVVRAVRQFVPRLPGSSKGSVVTAPRNGWTAVYDELCDRDPEMLRRLARELSDRMGAVVLLLGVEDAQVVRFVLLERGRLMDEYLSVPQYHGELPPGDVISLAANPTVVARLTGADPAEVRRVIRNADRPEELAPAPQLIGEIAAVLGVEGAGHGYDGAGDEPGAVDMARD